ncbi:trehalase-domain-containing protein [Xylaria sp. CBS 124048]|nr:trehalase-domain-containing protein [Xylaria sp. CBS 124048]
MASRGRPLRRRHSLLELNTRFAEHDIHLSFGPQDAQITPPQSLLVVDVQDTLTRLIEREDTDGDGHITIEDKGPKVITLGTGDSSGYRRVRLRGNWAVSSLHAELTSALETGNYVDFLDGSLVRESPLVRILRSIKERFWPALTRRLDADVIELAVRDTKVGQGDGKPVIYVPRAAARELAYYSDMAAQRPGLGLEVISLPDTVTKDVYKEILKKPGVLALATEDGVNPETGGPETRAVPFVVPGGRFNEFFGWDSYFIGVGLLQDGRTDLVEGVLRNWAFEIQHYGLIPNANRSYLMQRSQPPFLTDLAVRLYQQTREQPGAKELLRTCVLAAIKEYHCVWVASPRLDVRTGLSKYCPPGGFGIPTEVEPGHFDKALRSFAARGGMSVNEFTDRYNDGQMADPELEDYLQHDRSMRESGHDTSTRFHGRAANLVAMDLNFCLYKYETDIAFVIDTVFDGRLEMDPRFRTSTFASDPFASTWRARAEARVTAVNKYLWNEEAGSYFDYHAWHRRQETSESATCFWALWCGIASPRQASLLVSRALPKYEHQGGLASCSAATSAWAHLFSAHVDHQWDFPYGWAPHQMLAWQGLARYGYGDDAARLAYRWLYTILKVFVDYNGAVCEKYDVTREKDPHRATAEYGNQGTEFVGYAREGFGWTNASFVFGLTFLDRRMRRALSVVAPYDSLPPATVNADVLRGRMTAIGEDGDISPIDLTR